MRAGLLAPAVGCRWSLPREDVPVMLSSVALVAALCLAPAEVGQLQLTNDRPTHGLLGATRSDLKFLPGDFFFLTFDIEGLQVNERGKALYTMAMEFLNK